MTRRPSKRVTSPNTWKTGREVEIGEQSKEGGRGRKDGSGWARSVAGGGAGVAVGWTGDPPGEYSHVRGGYIWASFLLPPPTSWPLLSLALSSTPFLDTWQLSRCLT